MRSFWMRRAITASAPVSASRSEGTTLHPSSSMPAGISVEGPPTRTVAPSLLKQWMFERATRLCAMSPTMATVLPSSVPQRSRRLSASRSPWVGCSWKPSPALITLARTARATSRGAPAAGWRTTSASAPMASRLRTVSSSDSPLETLEASFWKLSTSAPSAFAATSNELRVRVLLSKKSVITLRPRNRARRSAGDSPADRALARSRLKRAASERSASICPRLSASSSSRCLGKSISDPMQEPPREVRREACLEDLPCGLFGVVLDPVELYRPGLIVPDAVAGARVVIPRLAAAPDRDQVMARAVDPDPLRPYVLDGVAELERALQVRMADERQLRELLGGRQQILGLIQGEDVLERLRLARRSVAVRHVTLCALVWKSPQPLHVFWREVQRRPVEHLARRRVVVAVVHPAGHGGVVVAQHAELAPGADQIAGGVRIRAITYGISETNEAIDLLPFRRFDARRERLQVGVDIRQDGSAHRRRPEYTARALTSRAPDAPLPARWQRLLERQLMGPLHPAAQGVRIVVEGLRNVDPALPGGASLPLHDRERFGARQARQLAGGSRVRHAQRDSSFPDQRENASVGPERLEPEHALLFDQAQTFRRIEEELHQVGVEAHPTCPGSSSKCTRCRKASNRRRTCARSRSRRRSQLNCSTVKEAMVAPMTVAWRSATGSAASRRSSRPRKPPANVSPAPVGSRTSASGKAGAKKLCSEVTRSAPYSPRFTTTALAPMRCAACAALITLLSPASWRTSPSLTIRTSTRSSTLSNCGRLDAIQ